MRSPAFSKSQRYPAFLRYCVEAALDGRARSLKERTIGIDVSERPVGYDPATDHVLRSAACEVRKRLAQYYQVITRVRDKGTGQSVVILGGIDQPGTSAATGFLTDPAQLQKLQAVAPDGWQDMNLQVVLSTDLVNGVASHPQIVATQFW